MNLVILFGGKSVEHDVSIVTFHQVLQAIDMKKYKVIPIYIGKDNNFYIFKEMDKLQTYNDLNKSKLKQINFIKKKDRVYIYGNGLFNNIKKEVDVVMNLTHGKNLEDGTISGYLQMLGVVYTSPKVTSSALFHHKLYTKLLLGKENIKTCDYYYLTEDMWYTNRVEVIKRIKSFSKRIVKPCSLGSSVGVTITTDIDKTIESIDYAFKFDKDIIIEKCLNKFMELNQAFYRLKGNVIISKIEEVKNDSSMYTFEKKYENGNLKRVIPAQISNNLRNKITKITRKIGYLLNSKGVCRVDYLYDLEDDKLYVNEVNVIPGALSYYLFEAKDIYFTNLIDDLITEAVHEHALDNTKVSHFESNLLRLKNNSKLKK